MAYLIAAIVITLSDLEDRDKCDIFALVLLFIDLFPLLNVHLICANKYLLTSGQ